MKIDIHVHTRKIKSGDAHTREIDPKEFAKTVMSTDVGILAITNHNIFDLSQYNQILEEVGDSVQVWPGAELDIIENGRRSHLILIVSPSSCNDFSQMMIETIGSTSVDDFSISIDEVVAKFDRFNPIYVVHYMGKKPGMHDLDVDRLSEVVSNSKLILKEATNSISAGILIAHGHASIFGSDVQDWNEYPLLTEDLPELRLPVDSFEQFCLLLEKDASTINTLVDRKRSDTLDLEPFEDGTRVKIKAYDDINVVFGPKGTGKTKILEAISRHYSTRGVRATVYESKPERLANTYDLKGANLSKDLDTIGIDTCREEMRRVKESTENDITSLRRYCVFFEKERSNRNATLLKIKDLHVTLDERSKTRFGEYHGAREELLGMIDFLLSCTPIKEVADDNDTEMIIAKMLQIAEDLMNNSWEFYLNWKSSSVMKSASALIRQEVARKTGTPSKPTETGFISYARNRIQICLDSKKICFNLSKDVGDDVIIVGSLGSDKGVLHRTTSFALQDGDVINSLLTPLNTIHKRSQKRLAIVMREIGSRAFLNNLFDSISTLNDIEEIDDIDSLDALLMFWRRFTLDGETYTPSNGESSMLSLHSELMKDKDVYILDEPEKSLGNEYINDVIVPQLNEKAKESKIVFIATHDANIAVRTLPYNSIYRYHDKSGYSTFTGNPFSNNLICQEDPTRILDWKKTSMTTLEGGETAFGERGKVYGNG